MLSPITRYVPLFLAMVAEGPLVTLGAASAASFGYFNVCIVFVLSVAGDFAADAVYYGVGMMSKYGRWQRIWRYLRRKAGHEYWERIEEQIKRHSLASIAAVKLAPGAPGPGLLVTGAAGVPFRTFLVASLLVAVPKSAVLVAIGYWFGYAIGQIEHVFHLGALMAAIVIPALAAGYLAYRFLQDPTTRRRIGSWFALTRTDRDVGLETASAPRAGARHLSRRRRETSR